MIYDCRCFVFWTRYPLSATEFHLSLLHQPLTPLQTDSERETERHLNTEAKNKIKKGGVSTYQHDVMAVRP